jgi:hypothetical protein
MSPGARAPTPTSARRAPLRSTLPTSRRPSPTSRLLLPLVRRLATEPAILLLLGGVCGAFAATLFFTNTNIGDARFRTWSLFAMDAAIALVGGGLTAFAPAEAAPDFLGTVQGEFVTIPANEWRSIGEELARYRRRERSVPPVAPPRALAPAPPPRAPVEVAPPRKTMSTMGPLAAIAAVPRRGSSGEVFHEEVIDSASPPEHFEPAPEAEAPAKPEPRRSLPPPVNRDRPEVPAEPPVAPAPKAPTYDESMIPPRLPVGAASKGRKPGATLPAAYDEDSLEEMAGVPIPTEVKDLLSKWYGDREREAEHLPAPSRPVARPALSSPAGGAADHCVVCQLIVAPEPQRYVCRSCGEPLCDSCWVQAREGGHPEVCSLCRILGNSAGSPRKPTGGSETADRSPR